MFKQIVITVISGCLSFFSCCSYAYADGLSPSIKDTGKQYSKEKPLSDYYGTGQAGRLSEASALRFEVEDLLQDDNSEEAVRKAKKAVQLDPGDPSGHMLLARALSAKFYDQKGTIDEKLLRECIKEWQMIRYHDSDYFEQQEASGQARKLIKIAKDLEKDRKHQEKIAQSGKTTASVTGNLRDTSDKTLSGSETNSAQQATAVADKVDESANKKKFLFF